MVQRLYALSRVAVGNMITHRVPGTVTTCSVMVSISTTPRERLITTASHVDMLHSYGFRDWLELSFVDVLVAEFPKYIAGLRDRHGHNLFSYEQARSVVAFVDKHKGGDIDRFVAHCDMGQSRSGAVVAWAFQYLSEQGLVAWPEEVFWGKNPEIMPNRHVYTTLCEVSGIEPKLRIWGD